MAENDTPAQVLACPMPEGNDAKASTIRDYLVNLLAKVWREAEGFSGKRPFGNSGWDWDLFNALAQGGLVTATFDDEGWVDEIDEAVGHRLIADAIEALRSDELLGTPQASSEGRLKGCPE